MNAADFGLGVREALDALPGFLYVLHPAGNIAFANRAFAAFTGQSRDEASWERWSTIIHPDDFASSLAALHAGLSSRAPFRVRQRIRSAAGTYRQFDSVTAPHFDTSGEIKLWLGVASDITEIEDQARATFSLAESERRMRVFLDTIPVILWTADASGWIDWYNPRWYEFTGQTPQEAAGWGWQTAHHPDDFGEVMRRWPNSIETGEPFEMEFRLRRADGIFRWMLTRVVPLRDEAGNVVRWYGSNTDIDDQKRAQQRTTRLAEMLQEALLPDTFPSGEGFRFDGVYRAAELESRIGGDWFDVASLTDGRIAMSIGDVTGHGIEAAAHAARLRQAISFCALEDPNPVRILARVNRLVLAQRLEIATAGVAVFDPATMTVVYALAGHPPPIVAHAGGDRAIEPPGGTPLGATDDFTTVQRVITLRRDSIFAFYTDGVTEHARDIERAETDLVRAAGRLVDEPQRHARPALALYDAALFGAPNTDDAAIVALQARSAFRKEPPRSADLSRTWRFHSSHARSARNARRELADYVRAYAADPAAAFEAELVIGEIVANTVQHAPGLVEIAIDWTGSRPRIRASDSGGETVAYSADFPSDPLAERGRGLPIIFAFASDVSIERNPDGGTTIACTLPLDRET